MLLVSPTTALQAAQSEPAKFTGIVVDKYVARIPKASVLIEGSDRKWSLTTDADGSTIGEINLDLPPGRYKFTIDAPGFKRLVVPDLCVTSKTKVTYEFQLEVRDCDDCGPKKPSSPDVAQQIVRPERG